MKITVEVEVGKDAPEFSPALAAFLRQRVRAKLDLKDTDKVTVMEAKRR